MTQAMDGAPAAPQQVLLRPTAVTRASRVTILWAVFTVLTSLSLFSERAFLRKSLVDGNAKAKKPVTDLTGAKLDDAVHNALVGGMAQSVLMVVILVLLSIMLMRGRGWARWTLMLFATVLPVLLGVGIGIAVLFFGVITGDSPLLYRIPLICAGLCSLAVLILLLMPETNRYFNALRPPGRRGMFSRPVASGDGAPATAVERAVRTPPAGGARGLSGAQRRHSSAFGALFASRRPTEPSADPGSDHPPRPGTTKAKGSGARPGRSKSRQE